MKQQNDWFTGIDYFDQYKEKDIRVDQYTIDHPLPLQHHIQVELWYILDGSGEIKINGIPYPLKKDRFFCLYSYHLYEVTKIQKPVKVITAYFYIGVFMHMMWEKHNKGVNARIVYETTPSLLCGQTELPAIMKKLYKEANNQEFGSRNMMLYLVLEAHMLYCRYALMDTKTSNKIPSIWNCIQKIIVSPSEKLTLEESAKELKLHPQYLNEKIKQICGYSFHELSQYSMVLNACALLHFEELSISYIVDLLNMDSTSTFYRIFEKFTGKKPLDYRKENILQTSKFYTENDLYLQIQQYLHLHFHQNITLDSLSNELKCKSYTINQVLKEEYQTSFTKELMMLRVTYACVLLSATSLTITKIAMDCGFTSISAFQRGFQQLKNVTPKGYRTLMNENKT